MSVRSGPESNGSDRNSAYDAVGYGMTFALSTLLFFIAGVWVDGRLGSSPLFAFLGLLVGGAAGFWWMYARLTGAGETRETEDGSAGREIGG
jgi:F0F1-type ATP synthase assembly protein I